MDKELQELNKALQNLPDTPETRRKALLLKRYLIADQDAQTRFKEIEYGIFSEIFSEEESALGERLFNLIKEEFQLESTKDLMDLHLMIMNYLKTRRISRIQVNDLKLKNIVASIAKKWQDNYSSLGKDLAISRQQRLVRRLEYEDETGSITKIFASIGDYERDNPEEVAPINVKIGRKKSQEKSSKTTISATKTKKKSKQN